MYEIGGLSFFDFYYHYHLKIDLNTFQSIESLKIFQHISGTFLDEINSKFFADLIFWTFEKFYLESKLD